MDAVEVQECGNGLILDAADRWKVVSNSMYKFFNHGQTHADPSSIDWTTARVFERFDGKYGVLMGELPNHNLTFSF